MSTANALVLRPATPADAASVADIYGYYVRTHPATFELDAPDTAEMARRIAHVVDDGYPYWVAERNAVIVGYCYASMYRDRPAYRGTVEDSVYVAQDAGALGVGSALLARVIDESKRLGFREMIAVIGDSANEPSIRLHRRHGFVHVGVFRNVGFKLGRWLDTVLMQRTLAE